MALLTPLVLTMTGFTGTASKRTITTVTWIVKNRVYILFTSILPKEKPGATRKLSMCTLVRRGGDGREWREREPSVAATTARGMVGMGRLTLPLVTPLAAETTLQLVDYRARTLVRRRTGRAHQLGSARTRATVRVRSVVVLEIAEKIGKRGMHAGEGGKVELSRGGRRTRKSESAAKPSRCTRAHPNLFLETEQVQERHKWQSLTLANLGHGVTQEWSSGS
ncbi:hypothetical protein DFH94DRAFT_847202 [Russula ochroleuca]|uniref:Secreted protein n=1 Tax=Russula ochroleuca TaxID=152965 RepID=A0A9P5K082_9AGAM|nr:hypothetical protein DFH94DRAFT_847202 [Russula ochroleuca]